MQAAAKARWAGEGTAPGVTGRLNPVEAFLAGRKTWTQPQIQEAYENCQQNLAILEGMLRRFEGIGQQTGTGQPRTMTAGGGGGYQG